MELNRELCQRCRQGVMLFEQDNSLESSIVYIVLSFLTSLTLSKTKTKTKMKTKNHFSVFNYQLSSFTSET